MDNPWLAVAPALPLGLGTLAWRMMAEGARTTRLLNLFLHAASGIVIPVVAIELMPEALENLAVWRIAAARAAGGLTHAGIEVARSGASPSISPDRPAAPPVQAETVCGRPCLPDGCCAEP